MRTARGLLCCARAFRRLAPDLGCEHGGARGGRRAADARRGGDGLPRRAGAPWSSTPAREPDETLRGFVAGRGARQIERAVNAGARWIRFAEAPEPGDELDRLLKGFVERFGSLPISNAGTVGAPAAAADGEPA